MKSITIRPIKSGGRVVRYQLDYYDREGRRQRPSVQTAKEAQALKRELLMKLAGVSVSRTNEAVGSVPLVDAIRRYVDIKSQHKACAADERRYFEKFYDYLHDVGATCVGEVTPLHLEEFQTKLRMKVSAATVNRHFNCYRAFFSTLRRWGIVAVNPAEHLTNLRENPRVKKLWTLEQAEAVIKRLPKHYGDFLFMMASLGLANCELRRLNWCDINFDHRVITVRRMKGNGEAKIRVVPLPENVCDFLGRLKNETGGVAADDQPVFVNTKGNRIENQAFGDAVKVACEELGFEGLVPYGLRHTFATELEGLNTGQEQIQRLMGHSRGSKVTGRYTHVGMGRLREAVESTPQASLRRS